MHEPVRSLMNYVMLGRTGLRVSRAGLGCGGPSRLGFAAGARKWEAIRVIQHALALGINIIDTAPIYGTEACVGEAIKGKRHQVILATKTLLPKALAALPQRSYLNGVYRRVSAARGRLITGEELRRNLERSLKTLKTDYVDIFYLHAVTPNQYLHCVTELIPMLDGLRREGKIRFLGISESIARDPAHRMLVRAFDGEHWDVIMLGFHACGTAARKTILPVAISCNLGVLAMGALRLGRNAFERSISLTPKHARGDLSVEKSPSLSTCDKASAASPESFYHFCAQEPGVHVVLTGTGSTEHLTANVRAINAATLSR